MSRAAISWVSRDPHMRHPHAGPPRRPTLLFMLLVRGLQGIAGLVTMYGMNGMLTSAGVQPPNVIVLGGIGLAALAALAQIAVGVRWYAGWWLLTGALSASLVVITFPAMAVPECAGQFPPPGTTRCASSGSHSEFLIASLVVVGSIAGALASLRRRATR